MFNGLRMKFFSTILLFMTLCVTEMWAQASQFRLFSPLRYDPNVTKEIMNRDSAEQSLEDRILLDMYIKHPELVEKDIETGTAVIGETPETPPSLSLTDTTKVLPFAKMEVPMKAPKQQDF